MAVAVVVEAVAELGGAGVDEVAGVVAVRRVGDVAEGVGAGADRRGDIAPLVGVGVAVPDDGIERVGIVDDDVAVVVDTVAELVGAHKDEGVGVVAVGRRRHVAGLGVAGADAVGRVAVAIAIAVLEPVAGVGGGRLVRGAVAVIVEAVAELDDARRDGADRVVAVGAVGHEAGGAGAGHRGLGEVAIAVAVCVAEPGDRVGGAVLIDRAVAVVVDAVAELRGVRIDSAVAVVAVGGGVCREPLAGVVAIHVGGRVHRLACGAQEGVVVGVEQAELDVVAVLVEAVAHHLGRAGVDRRVVVRAIAAECHKAGPRDAVERLARSA